MDGSYERSAEPSDNRRRQMKMTHLLNGVAITAGLAIAAPAWTQGYPGPSPTGQVIRRLRLRDKSRVDVGAGRGDARFDPGYNLGDATEAPSRAPRYSRGRAPQNGASDGINGQSVEPTRTRPPSDR
jgi:hypothetical protein